MANLETVEDVLRCAIGKEVEANVFYNILSQYIDEVHIRAICNELAGEELEHKARLELEIMKLGITVKPAAARKADKTLPKPLDYMVNMAKVIQLSLPEILIFAMEKEKAAFRFYVDSLATVKDPQCRQTILDLAEEEARHKIRFELEYDKFMATRQEPPAQM
jgi:rubrerythrin